MQSKNNMNIYEVYIKVITKNNIQNNMSILCNNNDTSKQGNNNTKKQKQRQHYVQHVLLRYCQRIIISMQKCRCKTIH